MGILRRSARPIEVQHKATLGELKHRRVWLKSEPAGAVDNNATHWYVDARSAEGAINEMARRSKKNPALFTTTED